MLSRAKARTAVALVVAAVMVAAVITWALLGCAGFAESRAERAVDDLLPTYLGPADRYTTRVRVDSLGAALRGRLESVHIDGEQVHFAGGFTLDHLTLDLEAIDIDPRQRTLQNLGAATFEARLGQANLNRFVASRRPDIRGLTITLRQGDAEVQAHSPVLQQIGIKGLALPVDVDGRLKPVPGNDSQLDFVPDGAHISILPVPRSILDGVAHVLNPAVDLTSLPIPIHIRSVQIRPDGIYLTGGATPADIVRAAAGAAKKPAH